MIVNIVNVLSLLKDGKPRNFNSLYRTGLFSKRELGKNLKNALNAGLIKKLGTTTIRMYVITETGTKFFECFNSVASNR